MNTGKKGALNNHLFCDVCKINFNSNADFALHEFSKKHCDNLIRLAKQKPIVSKQKVKSEAPEVEKEPPKVNSITHPGSFAKYGYFVPGEVYLHSEVQKEFNTDYDPYLQKFAENPFKEKPSPQPPSGMQSLDPNVSISKKKKKKIRICQVCNVSLLTLPEYEAHMKSPQHIWKLKVTGMGVSAHFVKASTDLHTTDVSEEGTKPVEEEKEEEIVNTPSQDSSSSGPFPLLYCSDCELLLNSPQQYNAHINGKAHIDCAQRKAELKAKKEKVETPNPNMLYCYSCKISLNNVFQFNEHKNGKKHKARCRILIKRGITIPPEERVPGIPQPKPNKKIVYPELYEKLVLEKQETLSKDPCEMNNQICDSNSAVDLSEVSGVTCDSEKKTDSELNKDSDNHIKCLQTETVTVSETDKQLPPESCDISWVQGEVVPETANPLNETPACMETKIETEESKPEVVIITDSRPLTCSVCNENFTWQSQLDNHLATEGHFEKILELKLSGKFESEILEILFSDRNVVKPNDSGEFSCSVCNVTTGNSVEFDQHLHSVVHKYTEMDYQKKRTLEVKHMAMRNEKGEYFCKSCQQGWTSMIEFTQHLHCVKHKSTQKAQKAKVVLAKRKTSFLQNQRVMQNMKLKRLKITGAATDTQTSPEPKIDDPKHGSIDLTASKNDSKAPKMKKRLHRARRCPFPSGETIPPLMHRPLHPRFSRPDFIPPWAPFSSPRPLPFGPFCDVPSHPYFRPQRFLRPPWPRDRPPFPHF